LLLKTAPEDEGGEIAGREAGEDRYMMSHDCKIGPFAAVESPSCALRSSGGF
jgi:hypothetical protein